MRWRSAVIVADHPLDDPVMDQYEPTDNDLDGHTLFYRQLRSRKGGRR